jgi:hypothetical protein
MSEADRRLLAKDNTTHQVDESGEHEFVRVLTSGSTGEQLVKVLGIENSWQDRPRHDTDRLFLDERLEDFVQQHPRLSRSRCGSVIAMHPS